MQTIMRRLIQEQTVVVLAIILSLGFALRVAELGTTPEGLHADEASFLLNAEAILETGRDEDNRPLPLTLHSLIDPKPALYSYAQVPFVAGFGTTAAAARLPAVIAGVISLGLTYILLRELTKNQAVAAITTLLLAISPWHIIASRVTQEVIFSFVFVLAAILLFYKYLQNKNWRYLLPFTACSWLAMYTYHSAKVFLISLITIWLIFNLIQQKIKLKTSLLPFVLIGVALAGSLLTQGSLARFQTVSLFNNQEPQIILDNQILKATGHTPRLLIRTFYNKGVFYGRAVLGEYMKHFSFDFLFLNGGEPKRYAVPFHGLLYIIELPLILIGLAKTFWERKLSKLPLVFWLVLAPLPAALTFQETPSAIRSFPLVIPLLYFAAEGLLWLLHQLQRFFGAVLSHPTARQLAQLAMMGLIAAGYLWSIGYFWQQFAVQQKVYKPWYRNSPYSTIADELTNLHSNYERVLVTNDLRPLYAYFALGDLISISELQQQPLARNQEQYQVGKYAFNRGVCDLGELQENTLYVAETSCRVDMGYPPELKVVKTISYPDGTAVYELLEYQPG